MATHSLEEEPWRGAILRQTKRFGTRVMAFDAGSAASAAVHLFEPGQPVAAFLSQNFTS